MKLFLAFIVSAASLVASADVGTLGKSLTGQQTITLVQQITEGGQVAANAEKALIGALGAERTTSLLGAIKNLQGKGFGAADMTKWDDLRSLAENYTADTVVAEIFALEKNGQGSSEFGAAAFNGVYSSAAEIVSTGTDEDLVGYCSNIPGQTGSECAALQARVEKGDRSGAAILKGFSSVVRAGLAHARSAAAVAALFSGVSLWAPAYAAQPTSVAFATEAVTGFPGQEAVPGATTSDYALGLGASARVCQLNSNQPVCKCLENGQN